MPLAAEKSSEGKNLVLAEDSTLAGGKFRIALPGHEYMAVRLTRV